MTKITLKLWNNATNTYDIKTIYFDSGPIAVINQRFDLNKAYEIQHLKFMLILNVY